MKTGKIIKGQLLTNITKINQLNAQTEKINLPSEIIEATLPAGEEKYRDFVENAYDLIQSVDVNYKFLYVNRKWREVLDYNENDVEKLTLWDILRKDQIPRCMDFFKKVSEGKMLNQLETIFVAKNGEEKYVEGNVHGQFKGGKLITTWAIFRDITERKRIEQELEHEKLELKKSNAELTKLNEVKNQFLGMATHDLRNPLTIILTCSDLLLTPTSQPLTIETKTDFIQRIRSNAGFMLNLINDLLDITRIESGKLNLDLRLVNLVALIKHNLDLNSILAKTKQIELLFRYSEPIQQVMVDPMRIEQVLNNLISNAINYSSPNSNIEVTTTTEGNYVKVAVRDNGLGIAEDDMVKLFKPFEKTSATSASGEKSTGLGLAIAQKIVESHKGRIWVESKPGVATTAYFTIPVATRSELIQGHKFSYQKQ
jgi:PAS domain S-box-containing protein